MKIVDFKKTISYFNPYSVSSLKFNAYRDWKLIIIAFTLLLIVVFLVDGYVFWSFPRVLEEEIKTEEIQVITVDRRSLDNVLKDIKEKENKFKEGLPFKITDPSL